MGITRADARKPEAEHACSESFRWLKMYGSGNVLSDVDEFYIYDYKGYTRLTYVLPITSIGYEGKKKTKQKIRKTKN